MFSTFILKLHWVCIEFASNIKCILYATHIFKMHKSIWKISRMLKRLILFGVAWRFFAYQQCIENAIWKWKRDNRWKDEWKPDINRRKSIETQKKHQVPCSKKRGEQLAICWKWAMKTETRSWCIRIDF